MAVRRVAQRFVTLDGEGPLHEQVYRALRAQIEAGSLKPLMRLPSTRALSEELGLSRATVLQAYETLTIEGYARPKTGSGTVVAEALPKLPSGAEPSPSGDAAEPRFSAAGLRMFEAMAAMPYGELSANRPVPYDFLYGVPDAKAVPTALLARLYAKRAAGLSVKALSYAPPEGVAELRQALADYLGRARGVRCEAEQVLIVAGAQQGLSLVARTLLNPGDAALLESSHHLGARGALLTEGARLHVAPVDDEGLDVSRASGADFRLAYVTPSHHFPTGAVMSPARRRALLDWAKRHDAFIIEDDYDSEFRYQGPPIESLQGLDREGRVIYLGTFAKTLFPSLRLGFVVAPPSLVPALRVAKFMADWSCPTLDQLVMADFVASGDLERHLRRVRTMYSGRRAALLSALERELGDEVAVSGDEAGLHVLVRFPRRTEAALERVIAKAREGGVGVYSAAPYYLTPPEVTGLLLGFGLLPERDLIEGIRRLAAVVRSG